MGSEMCIRDRPYNILAGGKYDSYGMAYPLQNASAENNRDNIARFKAELRKRNINIMGEQ